MKTDVVLTMDEYLDQCCAFPKPVSPPAREARHVPITAEKDLESSTEAHSCRCDRWGRIRISDVSTLRTRPSRTRQFLVGWQIRGKQMEYLIVLGVVATMALYTLIIARCLRAPEWQ